MKPLSSSSECIDNSHLFWEALADTVYSRTIYYIFFLSLYADVFVWAVLMLCTVFLFATGHLLESMLSALLQMPFGPESITNEIKTEEMLETLAFAKRLRLNKR